jgi:phosphate transport system permease protein
MIRNRLFYTIIWFFSLLTLAALLIIVGYIMYRGAAHISWEFITERPSLMGKQGGILPVIVGTLYVTAVAIVIAAPIGIAAAVYFVEYSKEGRLVRTIRMFTEALAGIPSIIIGLFGFAFFVVFLGFGWSVLSGGLSVSLMILPILMRSAEEALKTVPLSYREGSLSLGASKWKTTYKIVLPCCRKGILTGLILSVGRVVGETAVIMLTVGGALKLPTSIFDSTRTMSLHMYILAAEGISQEKAFATAALLVLFILVINGLATIISNRIGGTHEK